MPKNTRRATVTRTITYTATIDIPGYPEETDATILTLAGGAAGNTGVLSLGELLSGSISSGGAITKGNWSITGTSTNVEPYIARPKNAALSVGTRVASFSPPTGYAAAIGLLFVVVTAGTTANTDTEPNWNLANGGTTTDGGVTYRTMQKFPSVLNFPASATPVSLGQIFRPAASSMKEYMVTTTGTTAASAPTWTSSDTYGASITSGTAVLLSITDCKTYAALTSYALGDIVKPSAASSEEYLVVIAGQSGTSSTLTATVATFAVSGTVTFKRIV
jgi:hypothetical protein